MIASVRQLVQRLATTARRPKPPPDEPESDADIDQAAVETERGTAPTGPLASLRAFASRTRTRMVAISAWLPVSLAVNTVVAMYVLTEPVTHLSPPVAPLTFVLLGLIAGLLAWVTGAIATNGDTRPERANPRSHRDLLARMQEAEATIKRLVAEGRLKKDAAAAQQLGQLKAQVLQSPPDPGWSTGVGYVNAWRDLHRVELAIVGVVDTGEFDVVLRHDELRVEGSKLDRKDSLVRTMIVDARAQLTKGPPEAARSLLRVIREAVNDFRDSRFEALVRNRMHIDRVSLLLGLAAWALLCLAILAGADRAAVTSVSAFYLIGAATGLFTQLRSGVSESLEDVFGYGHAQLRQTVLVSGIAGVAGVFLTSVAGAAAADTAKITILGALTFSPVTAVTAAAFGLAPGTLTDRLNTWAKANIKDLESTSGASSGQGSGA